MLANALPVGFSAEELGSGILQPGLESFSQTGVFPVLRELVFLKDIFRKPFDLLAFTTILICQIINFNNLCQKFKQNFISLKYQRFSINHAQHIIHANIK